MGPGCEPKSPGLGPTLFATKLPCFAHLPQGQELPSWECHNTRKPREQGTPVLHKGMVEKINSYKKQKKSLLVSKAKLSLLHDLLDPEAPPRHVRPGAQGLSITALSTCRHANMLGGKIEKLPALKGREKLQLHLTRLGKAREHCCLSRTSLNPRTMSTEPPIIITQSPRAAFSLHTKTSSQGRLVSSAG